MSRKNLERQNFDSRIVCDGGTNRRYRNPEFLLEQYVEQGKTLEEIANLCDVTSVTIRRWLERHDIEREPLYTRREWLAEQYIERRRSSNEIAESCGVSPSTIRRWLDRHEISRKPRYKKRDWLYDQYVSEGRHQDDIAAECDVAKTTICHWLGRHGITDGGSLKRTHCAECGDPFRYYPSVRDGEYCSNDCANGQRSRQIQMTCPSCEETFERRASLDTQYCSMACWGNGYQTETEGYYSTTWFKQREKALERDSYQCTVCGISDEEHVRRFGRGLEVHHKVPVRAFAAWDKPPADAHVLRNLTTVCRTHYPDAPGTTVEPSEEANSLE